MRPDWSKMDGLLPAVVQDADTAELLMVGYMNEAALDRTRETGRVTFFSRSRQALWTKGETSGNVLALVDLRLDCDADALLVLARPSGPVCHLGTQSCFGEQGPVALSFLGRLQRLVDHRKAARPTDSYTSQLFAAGTRRIAQKVGEEGVETALAGAAGDVDELIDEAADLLYHLLVLLADRGTSLSTVAERLAQRHGSNRPATR